MLDPQGYTFTLYSLPTLLTMAAVFSLGVFVLVRERITLVSVSFFIVTLAVSTWLFCFSWMYAANNPATAMWWSRAAYLGVPFIAPAAYQFTAVVLGLHRRLRRVILTAWLVSGLFAIAAVATDSLITGVERYWWGYYTRFEWLGLAFVAFFAALLVGSMAHYWLVYKQLHRGRARRRIRWLMLAFGVGYLGIVDFVAVYGVPLYPFGYIAILAFVALATRAIWTYHLIDITPAFDANEIIETMNDALLVFDREGVLRVANRAACEMFGYEKEELLGRPPGSTLGGVNFTWQLESLVQAGRVRDYELTYSPRGGGTRFLSIAASVMRSADGEPVAIVCIAHDITERRAAENEIRSLNESLEQRVAQRTEELQIANRELENEIAERRRAEEERTLLLDREQAARAAAEQAAHSREVMLSVVSHDLRNPLTAVKATVSMLRQALRQTETGGPSTERMQVGLARIDTAASKMDMMINEQLDFAQLQAGQPLELYRRNLNLVVMCRRVVAEYQQSARRHQLVLETGVPRLVGQWDPMRIERVLDNLISNAIKYSPDGGPISIEMGSEGPAEGGDGVGHDWVTLVVRDQGVGIPEADLPYIFDWFRRARNVTGRIRGTGIGLAVVRQVVEQHGGTIAVESREGEGSAFTIKLPLQVPEAAPEGPTPDTPATARGHS
ncbi:MAG TPA: ATP-binding protein [Chloroflexia bacterium]|nr:ATP-binding protein [Chloroflexia bacterium]